VINSNLPPILHRF